MSARKIVIGDIHGALKALEQIIAMLKVEKTDELIFMGDFVDGWSESARVVQYLINLEKTNHCIFIKGIMMPGLKNGYQPAMRIRSG